MSLLFQPATIGTLELRNRLVRSATAEHMADAEGRPSPQLADYYRTLAEGGVGLIITGHAFVRPDGRANPCCERRSPGCIAPWGRRTC